MTLYRDIDGNTHTHTHTRGHNDSSGRHRKDIELDLPSDSWREKENKHFTLATLEKKVR